MRTCPQWVCAAAKAGEEEGVYQIGGSCIIAPTGEIVVQATTDGDEVIVADMDLDLCKQTNMAKAGWSSYRKIECVRVRLACNVWPYQSIERCARVIRVYNMQVLQCYHSTGRGSWRWRDARNERRGERAGDAGLASSRSSSSSE